MEWLTFDQGVIWGQSLMLILAGWILAGATRTLRRQTKVLLEMLDNAQAMMNLVYCQRGIIAALQSGVVGPWALEPIDFSNLPIEMRLRILAALIDIGVQVRLPNENV